MDPQVPLVDPIPDNQPIIIESGDSHDQSSEDGITLISFDTNESGYVYNVPDSFEQNPEILRAELLFYNSPQTQQFSSAVYYSLKNVQDQCSLDYVQICDQSKTYPESFFPVDADLATNLANLFSISTSTTRKLSSESESSTSSGRKLIDSFRSYYQRRSLGESSRVSEKDSNLRIPINPVHPHVIRTQKIQKREEKLLKASSESISKKISSINRRQLRSKFQKREGSNHHPMFRDDKTHDNKPPRGPPRDDKPPQGPPHDGKLPQFDDYSDSGSDSEDENNYSKDNHHKPGHKHEHNHDRMMGPQGMPQLEDTYFPGALGFGAQGDICLYQNVEKLTQPCLQSISDVYTLRQMYWENQSQPYHHGHGFFLLLIGLALIFGVKRLFFYKRQQNIRNLLQGLHNNPDLKNIVEAKLGIEVPKTCPHSRQCSQGSLCKRIFFTVGFLIFAFIASLCVAISSLEITAAIVNHIDNNGNVGEEHSVSPMFALLILFTISLIEMSLVVFLIRKLKKFYLSHFDSDSSPSAPMEQNMNDHPSIPNNGNGSSNIPFMMNKWMAPIRRVFSSFGRRGYPEGYVPLNPDDSTEMIAVGTVASAPDQPRYAVYTGVPLNSHNVTVIPVSASPVNTVSFV